MDFIANLKDEQASLIPAEAGWKAHVLDLARPIADAEYLFRIKGNSTLPKGELIGLKGRAKQGKSQLEYYLISAILGSKNEDIHPIRDDLKVFLFDTEQSQASLKKCSNRALKTAELPISTNHKRFVPFFLKPLTIDEKKSVIAEAIGAERPDIIFIDGIRDLLMDFNSLSESAELISWLLKLTDDYKCTIVCVLHQNKNKEDGNMRGHLGTELLNKLTDCFEVTCANGHYEVTCTDSRNIPTPPFSFDLSNETYFPSAAPPTSDEKKLQWRLERSQRILSKVFETQKEFHYNELVRAYQIEGAVSPATAKKDIRVSKDNDLISANGFGNYEMNPKGGKT